jgi:hypothetical protein
LIKASTKSATTVIVRASVENVPSGSAHRARIHLIARDASTAQITATLSSAVFTVARGDSAVQASFLVDADRFSGKALEGGAYTLQAIVVAGPGTTATDDFQKILSVLSLTEGQPPFALQVTKEQGVRVLGEELEKVAAYEREIATGNADLIYRGLSHLVQYHRARGRHDSAEAKVNLVINRSDRTWMRSAPGQVVADLRSALEHRDLARLDAIAGRVDFKFGALGAEWQRLPWNNVRPYFERIFRQAIALELVAPTAASSDARQYAVVRELGRRPGLPTDLVFLIEKTPFGWQLGGLGGLYVLGSSETDAPPSPPPNAPPPPLPGGQDAFMSLKAPWLAGESMQAGGLSFDLDWSHFFELGGASIEPLTDLLFDTLIRTDRCGPTMPGFSYETGPTHQGAVRFAIDFMDGYGPVGCVDIPLVGEKCLPDPRVRLR